MPYTYLVCVWNVERGDGHPHCQYCKGIHESIPLTLFLAARDSVGQMIQQKNLSIWPL